MFPGRTRNDDSGWRASGLDVAILGWVPTTGETVWGNGDSGCAGLKYNDRDGQGA